MKDEDEIQEARDRAASLANKVTRYGGMTYEEGLRDALEWVLGDLEDDPTAD